MSTLDNALSKVEYVDIIRALHDKLKHDANDLLNKGLEMSNLILILDLAMKEAGKIKSMIGLEKRAIVVAVVKKFLDDKVQEVNQELSNLSNHVQEATDHLSEELKGLIKLADTSLDSFVDQLYQLAPEVYGKTKSRCKLFWSCSKCRK